MPDIFLLNLVVFVIIFFGILCLRIDAKVRQLELKQNQIMLCLDLILARMEIEVPDLLSEQVKELARNPRTKIAALKLYRQETGAGLKESLAAIETFIMENQRRNP